MDIKAEAPGPPIRVGKPVRPRHHHPRYAVASISIFISGRIRPATTMVAATAKITERFHCWTLSVAGNVDTKDGSVRCRDDRTGAMKMVTTRWFDGRWRATTSALRCPAYIESRIGTLLARLPKPKAAVVSRHDLARIQRGWHVRLELGDIILRVTNVHHGGLLVSGHRVDTGAPMTVRCDAVEEIIVPAAV